jgi:uncharacterized protein YndB with AHSA1/START domain
MPDFVPGFEYVTYIAATPEKVWQALTSPQASPTYFFGRSVEIDCRVGGKFVLRMKDGKVDSQGKVAECDPPRKLSFTWKVEWLEEYRHLPEALVTFIIEPAGEVTRLTSPRGTRSSWTPNIRKPASTAGRWCSPASRLCWRPARPCRSARRNRRKAKPRMQRDHVCSLGNSIARLSTS